MAEDMNLWVEAGNGCLQLAIKILDDARDTAKESIENMNLKHLTLACQLIETAISADRLNLDWDRTQSSSLAFLGRPSTRLGEGN